MWQIVNLRKKEKALSRARSLMLAGVVMLDLSAKMPNRKVLIRALRPALNDLRFKGDPWVVEENNEASVRLGDFQLGRVAVTALDLPSLNKTLWGVRLGQARRNALRKGRGINTL